MSPASNTMNDTLFRATWITAAFLPFLRRGTRNPVTRSPVPPEPGPSAALVAPPTVGGFEQEVVQDDPLGTGQRAKRFGQDRVQNA
ncbi:hypothetical protein GCM10027445_04190 [Amycolatopsis endophytica]